MIPSKTYRPDNINVAIRNNNGVICLRYSYRCKQLDLSLGIAWNNKANHSIAQSIALQIHNDIFLYGNYDESKEKYRIKKSKITIQREEKERIPSLKEIWEYYKEFKKDNYDYNCPNNRFIDRTINNYSINHLDRYFNSISHYSNSYLRASLAMLSSAINIYCKHKKNKFDNPIPDILETLKTSKIKTPKSYTQDEITAILDAFKNDTYNNPNSSFKHSYYYHLIAFRFMTGCRPSEAIALTWNDIIEKNGKTWVRFNKRYIKTKIKIGTKNGVDIRLFPVNKQLKELIDSISKQNNNLIFPSVNGGYINSGNFSQDVFKIVIQGLIKDGFVKEYLPFYDQRHTLITHLVRSGKVDIKTISSLVGNSVPTLIKNYLAVDESLELPELF
ncbi:tyrosine-type recombinase/integrase [Geminocystis sp. NIES-3709]|uniref:tyrosine-type recombinase/integrase n=1 Tax=Geminocystis sp. NIES-3709 TaxID=1617448 RepID=UPI0005FC77AD|nr:tyrosine-type recombinase/integrase [Geminocystis sp. NIES-3709]BAQ66464.1 phage integrase [Geminocystis sp. NIES-3709]